MKIPEPLFAVINIVVGALLRSPLHFLMSKDIMIITFTGRNSGRKFSTPVRYIHVDGIVRCFTSTETRWWRNLRGNANVELLIEGNNHWYRPTVSDRDPELTRQKLEHFLALFPQDAAYQNIRLNKDKSLNTEDLDAAIKTAIIVELERAE